jgi:riboflavin synthase
MFTGLVEDRGIVREILSVGAGIRLVVGRPECMRDGCGIGASIAINGCCLTVIDVDDDTFAFQAGEETLSKTDLGRLMVGDVVNLERSLPVDGRLGGHFVQGHVDGVGIVDSIRRDGDWIGMAFRVSAELAELMVPKGSVAVDGVSLTVVNVEADLFDVALIPHTLDVTTLGVRDVGDEVNIETDILGKYVQKLLADGRDPLTGQQPDEV